MPTYTRAHKRGEELAARVDELNLLPYPASGSALGRAAMSGELQTVKFGTTRYTTDEALHEYIASLADRLGARPVTV